MPVVPATKSWRVIHDRNKTLCFVGFTHYNKLLYRYFKDLRPCIHVSVEHVAEQSQEWLDQHQFICLPTHPKFKFEVKQLLDRLEVDCFSVISEACVIGQNVNIGYSCIVEHFAMIWDDCVVGDYCTVAAYVDVAHGTILGTGCHLSPYVECSFVTFGDGVYVGSKGFVFADMLAPITICNYVNILATTRVFNSIDQPGTYHGNRLTDPRGSLELSL
jgi:NDP-sugar pyrophosphorylase family protein